MFEDASPEIVRDFFWDDEFRMKSKWDDMLIYHKTLEQCPRTGTMIVHWVRKVGISLSLSLSLSIHTYLYICMHLCVNIYIYIYIYVLTIFLSFSFRSSAVIGSISLVVGSGNQEKHTIA